MLGDTPSKRRFLLTDPSDGSGVFPQGKVGILAAPGGTGKSYALLHIAIAVALGNTAFGQGRGWKAEQGRVLFLFGEDDREEVVRRLHYVARAAGVISEEDTGLLERNLKMMALAGQAVSLTTALDAKNDLLPETLRGLEARKILAEAAAAGAPYSLVILDPLSRFAGPDVETDNAAATRFIQVLESFAGADCGGPSVLISHHERKRQKEDDPESADAMRGSSALKDGVRWVARLFQQPRKDGAPDLVGLRVVKTNLTKPGIKLTLCRSPDSHGALQVASDDAIAAYANASGNGKSSRDGVSVAARVLQSLADGPASGNELATARLHVHLRKVGQTCRELESQGLIERLGKKWTLRGTTTTGATQA
jgi:hypothetical protein